MQQMKYILFFLIISLKIEAQPSFEYSFFIALEEQKDVFAPKELYHNIRKLPLYKEIRFTYKAEDGIKYGVGLQFDWEDILKAYKKYSGNILRK